MPGGGGRRRRVAVRVRVDASRPLAEEPGSGHNRWHPDLEPVVTVRPGEEITLETRDGLDVALCRSTNVKPAPTSGEVYAKPPVTSAAVMIS